jgi:iron complex outermembrane receptor protein
MIQQHRCLSALALFCLAALLAPGAQAQTPDKPKDLTEMSLEDLLNVQVTSVSKKEQKLSSVAAAVYVITQEDIRRSGATNLPDVLRMAPGVQVAQINASTWAISIRGFNARYSSNVLVLIDGRTVYSSSFSGVFWDQQDVLLENIERIEVIRGPGGTIWGSNAVNGVINIITKSSKATKGGLINVGGGSEDQASESARYGGEIGKSGSYRIFGKYSRRADLPFSDGRNGADGWSQLHIGFRSDWDLSTRDSLTVSGDLFHTWESEAVKTSLLPGIPVQTFPQSFYVSGGDVLGRWKRTFSGGSETSLQTYYNQYQRTEFGIVETDKTFDIDFADHLTTHGRNDWVWGLGYRRAAIGLSPGGLETFNPPSRAEDLFTAFVQDEIRLSRSVSLTVGSKFEHNRFTGFEYEPSARIAWTVNEHSAIWMAVSRAIREPTRLDTELTAQLASFPVASNVVEVVTLRGNPKINEEKVVSWEAGYRAQINKTLSLDVAGFLSFYHSLITFEPQPTITTITPSGVRIEVPLLYENKGHARTYGGEVSMTWEPTRRWKIISGYSYLSMETGLDPSSQATLTLHTAGDNPRHMFQVRSLLNLSKNFDFDTSLYYTAKLSVGSVPSHTRVDVRLAWRPREKIEFSLVGQNLLGQRSLEFADANLFRETEPLRSVFGKITWHF